MQQLEDFQKISLWQSELKHALKSYADIKSFFNLQDEIDLSFKCFIPLNFARHILESGPNSALWKQFIPSFEEQSPLGSRDPIGDQKNQKAPGIIHRYKNRVLFSPTTICPIICRYCFRKNELSKTDNIFKTRLDELGAYLKDHPEVNEVILTGGDPLILDNKKLEVIFKYIANYDIEFLRIHTRTPIILPNRIDEGLLALFKKYQSKFCQIIFVLHTNHQSEFSLDVIHALLKLSDLKIQRLTQSVLLKGINDSPEKLIDLLSIISKVHFSPYYLHHPDNVAGANHFRLSLEEGRKIYHELRDQIPGWMLPHYVIDHPDGTGKQFAYNPESFEFSGKLLNLNGGFSDYSALNT